jgi:nucleoside-diphosphate kinase
MKTLQQHLIQVIPNYKSIFVVVKPGFLKLSDEIIKYYKKHGWNIEKTTVKQLTIDEAKELYKVHAKESFYKDLCNYMSSDLSRAFIFYKINSLKTDPFEEATILKDEIRKRWGESDMRNVVHSSDSQENMDHESVVYFDK